jgi:predicted nucleotidyltransferase
LIASARQEAGFTQTELAVVAGVTQSVISAYETGRRDPTVGTLSRLIAATGSSLTIGTVPYKPGRLLAEILAKSVQIKAIAQQRGYDDIRIFGSVARGQETARSDIDVLVSGVRGLLQLTGLRSDLTALLGREVDVVPDYALKPEYRAKAFAEAVAL